MRSLLVALLLAASAAISFAQQTGGGGAGAGGGGGSSLLSQKVVYTSKLAGVTGGVAVIPGSSAASTTDSATALNTAIAGGNVDLEVDSGYALSTSLVLSSNTTIHCIAPQYGFIMQTAANASVLINANQNSPTTASGTGGFLPSNITDTNIKVQGCQLNDNSTQSATGTNSLGTAHGATPGGKFTYAANFVGVQNLTLDGNEMYDSSCWAVFLSNTLYSRVTNNYVHQPSPLVQSKFTDGIHHIGPNQFFWIQNNRINAGDDSIALNADDGNRAGSGDPNASYVAAAVKWGPELDGHVDNNTFDTTCFGLRLYTATELIDRIYITNTSGTVGGNAAELSKLSALGSGNIGNVDIDGWQVQSTGACNTFSNPYNFLVTANYKSIKLAGVKITNPAVNWPIWTETSAIPGIKSFRDWNLNTQSTGFSNLIITNGGTAGQVALSGLNWYDATGTGSVFSGTAVPPTLACSNYYGPPRLLAGGYAPTIQNGDCFTNTYASVPAAIHFWPMTVNAAGFNDQIGTTNLTPTNVTYSVTSGLGASAVAQFNGTNASAVASGVDSTLNFNGTQPMSVATWINPGAVTSNSFMGNLLAPTTYAGWEVGIAGPSEVGLLVVGNVTTNQMTARAASADLSVGTPVLVVVTYTGSLTLAGVKIYVNGASQTLTDSTGTLTSGATSTQPFIIGARGNATSFYNGAMAYTRVWNSVLTPAQVAALYALGPQ